MNIVILCDTTDSSMRKALDRYLSRLPGKVNMWNEEQVLAGQNTGTELREKMHQANWILLLVSQDFWASDACYAKASEAMELCRAQPSKKIAVVMLRPNSIEDTPFKDLPRLPASDRCISEYADPEQGYWDVYQGFKSLIDPAYRYKNRPGSSTGRVALFGTGATFFCSLILWLLPLLHREVGVRIVPKPTLVADGSGFYYTLYKLDAAAQPNALFTFEVDSSEIALLGTLLPSDLQKIGDSTWTVNQTSTVTPEKHLTYNEYDYYGQCIEANFNENDAGEYRLGISFEKNVTQSDLKRFEGRLTCKPVNCMTNSAVCANIQPFSTFHYIYLPQNHFYALLVVFISGLLLGFILFIKKT